MIPFGDPRSDIDYATFFTKQGAKGYHNPNYEQDNAPGGAADPGQSLRFSHISAANMNALRAAKKTAAKKPAAKRTAAMVK